MTPEDEPTEPTEAEVQLEPAEGLVRYAPPTGALRKRVHHDSDGSTGWFVVQFQRRVCGSWGLLYAIC